MCTKQDKEVKERIRYVLDNEDIKLARIGNTEGERTMMSRQINGEETKVPYITIWKILNAVPHLSADWLVMGEGSMYKADHTAPRIYNTKNEVNGSKAGGDINVGTQTIPYPVKALLDEKDARIAELEKMNTTLQNVVNAFTAGIKK